MAFAIQMHQVKLINQPLPLQQIQRSIDRAAINRSIDRTRFAQDLAGIQVFGRSLNHA